MSFSPRLLCTNARRLRALPSQRQGHAPSLEHDCLSMPGLCAVSLEFFNGDTLGGAQRSRAKESATCAAGIDNEASQTASGLAKHAHASVLASCSRSHSHGLYRIALVRPCSEPAAGER